MFIYHDKDTYKHYIKIYISRHIQRRERERNQIKYDWSTSLVQDTVFIKWIKALSSSAV
jgi:hypothetical protein